MNGCQLAVLTKPTAAKMNMTTTTSLIATMIELKRADSRMPSTRITVTASVISTAGRLISAPVERIVCVASSQTNGALVQACGSTMPNMCLTNATTYPDQP